MKKKSALSTFILSLTGVMTALTLVFLLGPRREVGPLPPRATPPENPAVLEAWVEDQETQVERSSGVPIAPPFRRQITWAGQPGTPTEVVLVYLPGFGAGRNEIAPVPQKVAAALGANLFITRWTAHGQNSEVYGTVEAGDWLADTRQTLEIGRRLGKKILLMGTSTGATLGTYLLSQSPEGVVGAVFVSPNYGIANKLADLSLWPWGTEISRWITGGYRVSTPADEAHRLNWDHLMRVEAVGALLALIREVRSFDYSRLEIPVLFMYTPHDEVIDLQDLQNQIQKWGPRKTVKAYPQSPRHVMAGDIRTPDMTETVVQDVITTISSWELLPESQKIPGS